MSISSGSTSSKHRWKSLARNALSEDKASVSKTSSSERDQASVRRASGVPGRSRSLVPRKSTCIPVDDHPRDNRVIINVGGVKYETFKSTLKNIPDTRLSWLTQSTAHNADYDPSTGEYFFDRHPGVFNMILNYYRTGSLHAPIDICGPLFEEELAFWGIDEKQIEPCCWMTYRTHREAQETLKELDGEESFSDDDDLENVAERFGLQEEEGPQLTWWQKWQPKVWALLEDPQSSKGAQVLAIISLTFILLSITTFCLETDINFRVARNESDPLNSNWTIEEKNNKSKPKKSLEIVDLICIVYFTIEFILRVVFCPSIKKFFKGPLNWVDLLSIVPYYIERIIVWINPEMEYSVLLQILKTFRLIRIFRIFKLTRHFSGLKILAHTIKASAKELLLLIMFLLISVLIFACLMYYAESLDEHPENDFRNIPIGFWWAVVTMTTIGYGDLYPRTVMGYIVGGICAVAGVLVLALPVPVIVNNFALYYSHAQAKLKLPKKSRKVLVGAADTLKTQTSMPGSSFSESETEPSPPPVRRRASPDTEDTKTLESTASVNTGISVIFTDETEPVKPHVPLRRKLTPAASKVVMSEINSATLTNGRVMNGTSLNTGSAVVTSAVTTTTGTADVAAASALTMTANQFGSTQSLQASDTLSLTLNAESGPTKQKRDSSIRKNSVHPANSSIASQNQTGLLGRTLSSNSQGYTAF